MKPKSGRRFTIGQGLLWIAVLAGLLATPRLAVTPERVIPIGLLVALLGLVLIHVLIEGVFGSPCPACGRWALRRLARHRRYYRCSACRARFKRFGFAAYLDASGPEDDAKFRKPTRAGVWTGFAAPEDLDGTASGALLDYKRTHDVPAEELRRPHPTTDDKRLEEAQQRVRAALKKLYAQEP